MLSSALTLDAGGGDTASLLHGIWQSSDEDLAALLNHRASQTGLQTDADLMRDAETYLGLDEPAEDGTLLSRAARSIILWRADQTRDEHGRFVAEGGTPVNTAHPRIAPLTKQIRKLEYARRKEISNTPEHKELTGKLNALRDQRRGEWKKTLVDEKAAVEAGKAKILADASAARAKMYQQHGKTAEGAASGKLNPIGQHVPRLNEKPTDMTHEPAAGYLKDQPLKSNDPVDAFNDAVEAHAASVRPNEAPLQSEAANGITFDPTKPNATPLPSGGKKESMHQSIEDAAMKLGGGETSQRMRIADLRQSLPGDRKEQDAALFDLAMKGKIVMYPMDDPREIKPADTAAAFVTPGGGIRQIAYWIGDKSQAPATNASPLQSASAKSMTMEPTKPNAPIAQPAASSLQSDAAKSITIEATHGTGSAGTVGNSGQPDNGGNSSGSAGRANGKGPKILTARADLTHPADRSVVSADLQQHLNDPQIEGAAAAIGAMDKHGGFLNADSTGVGKTRQQLAVAQTMAGRGQKVLIVSPKKVVGADWKKGTITGSFNNDSKAMGVPLTLNKGDKPLEAGQVHITTYENLGKLKRQVDKNTTVLFDEAHAGKNYASARAEHMRDAGNAAKSVMYSTATPADQPMQVGAYGRAKVFGDRHPFETFKDLGMKQVDQRTPNGTVKVWQRDPKMTDTERAGRIGALFDKMTDHGLMIKRELSMKGGEGSPGVNVHMHEVPLPAEAHEAMKTVAGQFSPDEKAQSLMAQRRQLEPYKVQHIADAVESDLKAGKRPVVFASRVNESSTGEGEDAVHSEGTMKSLKDELAKRGINDVSEIHGGVSDKQRQAGVDDFQSGKNRVAIGTIESGGTGINLNDTKGDAPRSIHIMTAPFSATENVQAAGRGHRLTSQSDTDVHYHFGDTPADQWNAGIIGNKMKTLGAAVSGQISHLDVSAKDEGGGSSAFKWRPLVKESGAVAPKTESATPSSEKAEAAIPTRQVSTKYGDRHVHSFAPTEKFWNARKAGKLPDAVSVGKNSRTGSWEASIWGKNAGEVAGHAAKLAGMGIHGTHFSRTRLLSRAAQLIAI